MSHNTSELLPTFAPTHDMATMALARIDEEIMNHNLALCKLYSLSPVFRLPPEILETIFILCSRSYYERVNDHPHDFDVPCWVNGSYVCRHWRNIALNCPMLWTYVFAASKSRRWTEEMSTRSKQASLKIYFKFDGGRYDKWWLEFAEKVMDHGERIQELRLDLWYSTNALFSSFLSKFSSCAAPRLRNLEISMADSLSCSPLLFRGDTPVLRTLELSCCAVPWYLFSLSSLTTLRLSYVPDYLQQNIAEFLTILGRMKDLRYLYLDRSFARAEEFISSPAFNTFRKISLPHLSRLRMVTPLSAIIALLSCINISLKTELRLHCFPESDSSDYDYTLLSPVLGQRFISKHQAPPASSIRSMVMKSTGSASRLILGASESPNFKFWPDRHIDWDCNVPVDITFGFPGSMTTGKGDCIIEDVFSCLPLTDVRYLHVPGPPHSADFWRKTLRHLPGLRHLKLSQGFMPDLASVLSLVDHDKKNPCGLATHDRGGLDHVLAPALEELELDRVIFSSEDISCCLDFQSAITRRALFDALSTRGATGGRVTMTRCRTTTHISVESEDSVVVPLDDIQSWQG